MKKFFLPLYLFFIASCGSSKHDRTIVSSAEKKVDALPGDCPYLTKDNHGRPVLSWVRMINDSSALFCFAVSEDGGKTFDKVHSIPSSGNIYGHSENMPKIIFAPSGHAVAIWGAKNAEAANKYAGLAYYAQSFDDGKTWTAAKRLVSDTAGFDQRYADIALLKNGEVAAIWLDNRKSGTEAGSAVYYASTAGSKGFTGEKLISEPACQCCRTSVFADRKGGVHVLYRGIINDSIRDMVHIVSEDGGNTFSSPARIHNDDWVLNGCPHTGPAMTENKEGMHFAWYTGGRIRGSFYTSSKDDGKSFSGYDSITSQGSHPQLSSLSNDNLLIVWDESVRHNNDFHKRIGMELRSPEGVSLSKTFISSDTAFSSYPVVVSTGATAVVAYSREIGKKNYIVYRTAAFGNVVSPLAAPRDGFQAFLETGAY